MLLAGFKPAIPGTEQPQTTWPPVSVSADLTATISKVAQDVRR